MGVRIKSKRWVAAALSVAVASPMVPAAVSAEPESGVTITSLSKYQDHVKIEWSTEMPDSDVITRTGFEDGDDIPVLTNGNTNPLGQQSVVAEGSNHVLQLLDTVTGRLGNNIVPPASDAVESIAKYAAKSLPDDIVLSLNYRVKAVAGDQHNINMVARSGWWQEGYSAVDNQGQDLAYDELVDWNNPPAEFKIRRKSGGAPVISDGRAYTVVTSKDKNYNYGILRYAWNQSKSAMVLISTNIPWNDGTLLGPAPTINKDTFFAGDSLLTHKNASFTFPNRVPVTGEGWVTLSSNVKIPEMTGYDSLTKGFALRNLWSTNGELLMDDVKLGYATEVDVQRDGTSVYRGYLSDYEDKAATDKTEPSSPLAVSSVPAGKKVNLSWTAASDVGTNYTYQIVGYPKNAPSILSSEKTLEVKSGIKGYGVVVDKSPTTEPGSMNVTGTTFEADRPAGDYYVHIRTYDNAGNASAVFHQLVSDTSLPTGTVVPSTTAWTKGPIDLTATGFDVESWVDQITLPDNSKVPSDTAVYRVSTNGTYPFVFRDTSGNQTTVQSTVSNIDNEAPVISFTEPASWSTAPSKVGVSVTDAGSSVEGNSLRYSISSSATTPAGWTPLFSASEEVSVPSEGVWYVHVQAADKLGNEQTSVSNAVSVQNLPSVPTLTQGVLTEDSVQLLWTPPSGVASGYMYTLEDTASGVVVADHSGTTYTVTGLSAGSSHAYRVKAKNNVGESVYSAELPVLTLPGKPDNLSVGWSGHGYSDGNLQFDPVPSASAYRVVVEEAGSGHVVSDQEVSGPGVALVGLGANTAYSVSVTARNAAGWGSVASVSFRSLPGIPGGLGALTVGETSVQLGWEGDPLVTGYAVSRDGSVTGAVYAPDIAPLTTYWDRGLTGGTRYQYGVAAQNETGEGTPAELEVETLPGQPTGLTASAVTSTSFDLSWQGVNGATGYEVTLEVEGQPVGVPMVVPTASFTSAGLPEGASVKGTVRAVSGAGKGAAASKAVRLVPAAMGVVGVSEVTESSALLTIPVVAGADTYELTVGGSVIPVGAGPYRLSGLQPGSVFSFSVAARNESGVGLPYEGGGTTKVGAPERVGVDHITGSSARLFWEAAAGATGYRVVASSGKTLYEGPLLEVVVEDLTPGEQYEASVVSVAPGVESAPVPLSWSTLPGWSKGKVTVSNIGVHTASLSWDAAKGAVGYRVYNEDGVLWEGVGTEADIEGLPSASEINTLHVAAYGPDGEGAPVSVEAFMTKPSNAFTGVLEKAEKGLTLKLTHRLQNEVFVAREGKEEVYRGQGQNIALPKLSSVVDHELVVITENSKGDKSEGRKITYSAVKVPTAPVTDTSVGITPDPVDVPKKPEVKPQPEPPVNPVTPEQPAPTYAFTDIGQTFSRDEIQYLYERGYIKGRSSGAFAPNDQVTRIEFASMLVRALGVALSEDTVLPYTDIRGTAWYIPELKGAVRSGIAEGYSKQEFKPDLAVNREQATRMLVNARWGELNGLVAVDQMGVADGYEVSGWAAASVRKAVTEGVVEGYPDGSFKPKAHTTRAEAAKLIYELVRVMDQE